MSPLGALGRRWDWRHWTFALGSLVIAAVLVGVLTAAVIDAIRARNDAVNSLKTARTLTVRRIDLLNNEIEQLTTKQTHSAKEAARLTVKVQALATQVKQLGGTPVVVSNPQPAPQPTTTTTPTTTPTTRHRTRHHHHRRRHHHHHHRQPAPSPTPTSKPCRVNVPGTGCLRLPLRGEP